MAGLAAPLRASSPEERDAKGFGSGFTYATPLLAGHPAAEATDRTWTSLPDARRRVGRDKNGTAEILLESVRDIIPELGDLGIRAALRVDFHDGAAVDHRGREVRAVVKRDWSNRAVLRKRDGRLIGDLGLRRRRIDDEDERLAGPVAKIDRRTNGAKVVRAWAGRNDDQLGDGDDALNCHGDRRRGVDDSE